MILIFKILFFKFMSSELTILQVIIIIFNNYYLFIQKFIHESILNKNYFYVGTITETDEM